MDKQSHLTTEERENLIAYLDGELDEQATRRMEDVLVQSSMARTEVESLARTYDLLDKLPRPNAPNDFVERTVATAKMEPVCVPLLSRVGFRKFAQLFVLSCCTLILIAVATIASAISNRIVPDREEVLIRELPVIGNLDSYYEIDNLEFLHQLSAEPSLLDEMAGESGDQ